jgi:hypothetical protein
MTPERAILVLAPPLVVDVSAPRQEPSSPDDGQPPDRSYRMGFALAWRAAVSRIAVLGHAERAVDLASRVTLTPHSHASEYRPLGWASVQE